MKGKRMCRNRCKVCATIAFLCLMAVPMFAQAGMPTLLPTPWTAETSRLPRSASGSPGTDARWQTLSFFIACLLVSGGGLKFLWNSARREVAWLPPIGYGRALGLVLLWGLLSAVVLTMISGARELMTPGAWQKQGWTYQLTNEQLTGDRQAARRRALEQLRQELWQHAATHAGHFPSADDPALPHDLWNIPGWHGLRYLYVPDQTAATDGRLLVYEPELDGDERFVLLTNGFLGTMRTADIERLFTERHAQ
jgi:hypothetical protein